jgi:bifunctional DNase/RNase
MREVRLEAVRVDIQTNTPVLILKEVDGLGRSLPIYIGPPEAAAIAMFLQGVEPPRPLTHDLIKNLFDLVDLSLEKVVITELRDKIFYAELHIITNQKLLALSARPSDAVAVALRMGAPIYVNDDLIEEEGILISVESFESPEPEENPDILVGEFREFLDTVKPEDFGKAQ